MNIFSKKDVLEQMLSQTAMVHVGVKLRGEGLQLPPVFMEPAKKGEEDASIVLCLGLNMPIPIPDLTITQAGFSATLSFEATPHFCVVPWKAVDVIFSQRDRVGISWGDDTEEPGAQGGPQEPEACGPPSRRLRSV